MKRIVASAGLLAVLCGVAFASGEVAVEDTGRVEERRVLP